MLGIEYDSRDWSVASRDSSSVPSVPLKDDAIDTCTKASDCFGRETLYVVAYEREVP